MPLQTARIQSAPFTQADIPSTASAVRSATWEQALTDLPGSSLIRSFDLSFARELTAAPKYSAAEAAYFMEERGFKGEFTFDRDYNELELNLLASRKTKELRRREILSRADGSGSSAIGRFGISLASNLLDPISVGTSFVPVVGQAKYATLLANAGGKLGRAGVRSAVGAAEGVAGALLVEPFIVGAKLQEQAEYQFADSFLNVTIGGVFGGGLHVGLGAIGDAVRPLELPSKALPLEAERIAPTAEGPKGVDVGAAAGALDVPDVYHDSAARLRAAIRRTRDIDLSNPAAVSKIAGRQVLSISQYVRETGGIADEGGELSARDVTAKSMPGLVRKAGTAGADMDGVRERLFDSGYFPEKRDYNEISDTEVYDAIANDLAGDRKYPADVADLLARVGEEKNFLERLESQGITRDMDSGQIAARLRELDDEARELAPAEREGESFDEYDSVMAREDRAGRVPVESKGDALSAKTDGGYVVAKLQGSGHYRIGASHLPESARGQGYGIAMYRALVDEALSRGKRLESDETVEPGAVRMYEALARRGYVVERNPNAKEFRPEDGVEGLYAPRNEPVFTVTGRSTGAARHIVESADLPTREAALRVSSAQAATGESINVRPIFDRSAMLEAARTIDDPDSRPLTDAGAVTRADETIAGPDAIDAAAVQKTIADLQAHVKALEEEGAIDAGQVKELAAVVRAELEAATQAQKDAKELGRAASMIAVCALRHAV